MGKIDCFVMYFERQRIAHIDGHEAVEWRMVAQQVAGENDTYESQVLLMSESVRDKTLISDQQRHAEKRHEYVKFLSRNRTLMTHLGRKILSAAWIHRLTRQKDALDL